MSGGLLEVKPEGKKMPLDSAATNLREPISPRVNLSNARMNSGCMERRLRKFGKLLASQGDAGIEGASVVAPVTTSCSSAVLAAVVWFGFVSDGRLPQKRGN